MIDKKRLEEIDLNKTYNECGITGDLLSIELKPNDYYDLLEQAERVQELEDKCNYLSDMNEMLLDLNGVLPDEPELYIKLKKENKRYREAIEVAIQNMATSDNLEVKFALGILEQALDGEK